MELEHSDSVNDMLAETAFPGGMDDLATLVMLFGRNRFGAIRHRVNDDGVDDDDLAATNKEGHTILSLAAKFGRLDLVRLVVENTRFSVIPNYVWAPIAAAVEHDRLPVVQYLFASVPGAKDATSPSTGDSLLHIAIQHFSHDVLRWLLDSCPTKTMVNLHGETLLHAAVRLNNGAALNWLDASEWQVDAQTADGSTALHIAIQHIENEDSLASMLQLLLSQNASVHVPNHAGVRPIDLASRSARISRLLRSEPVFRRDFALHCMVRNGNVNYVTGWLVEMHTKWPEPDSYGQAIANALSATDMDGRTMLMYAAMDFNARDGQAQLLELLLPLSDPASLQLRDHEDKNVVDYLVASGVTCIENAENWSNTKLVQLVHAVCHRGQLPYPMRLTQGLQSGTTPTQCPALCKWFHHSSKSTSLTKLAADGRWDELQQRLGATSDFPGINEVDVKGYSVLHHVCALGDKKTFKLLLQQTHLDLDLPTSKESKTALVLAADNGFHRIVRALLHAGANPNVNYALNGAALAARHATASASYKLIYDVWQVAQEYPHFHLVHVPNVDTVLKHLHHKQTAMHVAMLKPQPLKVLDELCNDAIDLDKQDVDGETALMVAARLGHKTNLEYLLRQDVDMDLCNHAGETALMLAALAGHLHIVHVLLAKLADMDILNKNGQHVVTLVQNEIAIHGATPDSRSTQLGQILTVLLKEAHTRENSPEYRDKVARRLVILSTDDAFRTDGFAKALTCNATLGQVFLNDCVRVDRHEVSFTKLEAVYGARANQSALHAIVNLDLPNAELTFMAKKACLEHVAFRRLLQIKWELFAQRKYIEQLLMHLLLLFTNTTSSLLIDNVDDAKAPSFAYRWYVFYGGIAAVVFVAVGCVVVQALRPRLFWRLARCLYDGSLVLDASVKIPDLAGKKKLVRRLLVAVTITVTLAVITPMYILATRHKKTLPTWFAPSNNLVLWATALYFAINEAREMRVGYRKYLSSHTNKVQLVIYLLILIVMVPMKFNYLPSPFALEVMVGGLISLALWVLSLQFLEVVHSASFLLPMMADLFGDIWNFFIVFNVFQLGLTITFYQLFSKHEFDPEHHEFFTLQSSFITTFFVAFGQAPTSALEAFSDAEKVLYTCAAVLMMLHSAVVVIILLNTLIAMMNKTVDGGLEKAKTQALISYAQCILRIEEARGLDENETFNLLHLGDATPVNESSPLAKPTATDLWLNPMFSEPISKVELGLSAEQNAALVQSATDRAAWATLLASVDATITEQLDYVHTGLLHVGHFTSMDVTTALRAELGLLGSTRQQLHAIVDEARRSRGVYRTQVLEKLHAHVKRRLHKLENHVQRVANVSVSSCTS
ncbi:hypothetical protein SPRG_04281 [Saprolegnia parasitica CBS 223.65]|uniref:Uncharacterized protein n=1 Tax=Saprolegnia parasitica (strain CBS 223.65) TaxID=695850 RepID=A0A067CKU0_SAPPC|nr:hypothetical protein SPRG_04281 [Saprolegnia parasitica CBS 223.65]KDO31143.1 hypothetical protein SPRG_04281 [Saprolegnia parasitica CBS 223.65]|eukprot:XP_012198271.1 hypothetical protein SPRG_04281 [Saprolegnia parasitica CBS 223.65]